MKDILKSGGNLTSKREHTLQPGLLEPCAVNVARTVLRGGGGGDMSPLPDNFQSSDKGKKHPKKFNRIHDRFFCELGRVGGYGNVPTRSLWGCRRPGLLRHGRPLAVAV